MPIFLQNMYDNLLTPNFFQTGVFLTEVGDAIGLESNKMFVLTGTGSTWEALDKFCQVYYLRIL